LLQIIQTATKEKGTNTMDIETTTVTVTSVTTAAAPKRTRNEGTMARIEYEQKAAETKRLRIAHFEATMKPEQLALSKGYLKCKASLQTTEELVAKLQSQLQERLAEAAEAAAQPPKEKGKRGPKGPQNRTYFEPTVGEDDPDFVAAFPDREHSDLPIAV